MLTSTPTKFHTPIARDHRNSVGHVQTANPSDMGSPSGSAKPLCTKAKLKSGDLEAPPPPTHLALLVIMLVSVVYCLSGATPTQAGPKRASSDSSQKLLKDSPTLPVIQNKDLPETVAEMRNAILAACRSGRMDDLQTALEWSELTPELRLGGADKPLDSSEDAIARWTKRSNQAKGRDVLAILANLLAQPATTLPIGRDLENHDVYIWPFLSQIPPAQMTPGQIVQLYRMMPASAADAILKSGKWTWYRLTIGADGTWHSFIKHN